MGARRGGTTVTDLTPPEPGGQPSPDDVAAVPAQASDVVAAAPAEAPIAAEAAAAGAITAAAAPAVPAAPAPAVQPMAAPAAPAPAADTWVQPPQPVGPPPGTWAGYTAAASPRSGPAAGWEYAGFWIRAVAWIIDGVILGVITTILWTVVIAIAAGIGFGVAGSGVAADGTITEQEAAILGVGIASAFIFLAIMTILVTALYFVLLWTRRGATIGQSILGLRVVRQSDGGPIGWGTSIIRYIVLYIGFAIIYLGVIWVAFDDRKRGWHDLAANTYVVKRSA
jgi:uncharacterized RDD family membrane protein YckC